MNGRSYACSIFTAELAEELIDVYNSLFAHVPFSFLSEIFHCLLRPAYDHIAAEQSVIFHDDRAVRSDRRSEDLVAFPSAGVSVSSESLKLTKNGYKSNAENKFADRSALA